ncbi:hypothetical protein BKA70DRAFT_178564 [Coprinopsis sp. MPI-PUGE-AT-0042]|nr:hypothetical protein BKA70DRAFT_178564 [Coprinopsis sp. MPI-PUGE-AT-0042]
MEERAPSLQADPSHLCINFWVSHARKPGCTRHQPPKRSIAKSHTFTVFTTPASPSFHALHALSLFSHAFLRKRGSTGDRSLQQRSSHCHLQYSFSHRPSSPDAGPARSIAYSVHLINISRANASAASKSRGSSATLLAPHGRQVDAEDLLVLVLAARERHHQVFPGTSRHASQPGERQQALIAHLAVREGPIYSTGSCSPPTYA